MAYTDLFKKIGKGFGVEIPENASEYGALTKLATGIENGDISLGGGGASSWKRPY